jgi:hypothetical protein
MMDIKTMRLALRQTRAAAGSWLFCLAHAADILQPCPSPSNVCQIFYDCTEDAVFA